MNEKLQASLIEEEMKWRNDDKLSAMLIDEEMKWRGLADIEAGPVGGNPVKEAMYRGTAAGLLIAAQLIVESERREDVATALLLTNNESTNVNSTAEAYTPHVDPQPHPVEGRRERERQIEAAAREDERIKSR